MKRHAEKTARQTASTADRQTDRHREKQMKTSRQAASTADRQTDRQTQGEADEEVKEAVSTGDCTCQ